MNRRRVCAALVAGLTIDRAGLAQPAPQSAFEYYQAGSRAFVEQRFDAAIEALRRSVALDSKRLPAVRLLGLSYQLAGQLGEAEATFEQACRLAPKDAEAWFYLGRLQYVRNYFDKALSSLQTAVKYAPADARIRECLALTYEAAADWTAAEREYRQAIGGSKPPATVSLNYGALLLKLNRAPESEPLLVKAVDALPGSWQARFELAKLYTQTDRLEAALRELKAALASAPKPEEASRTHGLMAVVYGRLGRLEEARLSAAAAER